MEDHDKGLPGYDPGPKRLVIDKNAFRDMDPTGPIQAPVAETAPTRATTLPTDAAGRKKFPVASGVLDYFPDALVAIAEVSKHGNDQHNPGEPLHWARGKSTDQDDTIIRHFLERGTRDKSDGLRHSAKMAWRALALLQLEIEAEQRKLNTPKTLTITSKVDITTAQQKIAGGGWTHPQWNPPLPLGSSEKAPGAVFRDTGIREEGSYRITVERERY